MQSGGELDRDRPDGGTRPAGSNEPGSRTGEDVPRETWGPFRKRKKSYARGLRRAVRAQLDELRALRALLRLRGETSSPYLFLGERGPFTRQAVNYLVRQAGERAKLGIRVHPHMLRHSTGLYPANRGCDTRLIQDYLGHVNNNHTVRYTKTAAFRFEGLWK